MREPTGRTPTAEERTAAGAGGLPLPSSRALALLGLTSLVMVFGFVTPWLGYVGLALDLVVLAAILVDGRRAAATPLSAARRLPKVLHQGEPAELALVLHNPGDRPVEVHLREILAPALLAQPRDWRGVVPAGGTAEAPLPLRPRLRGTAALAPATVRVRGPWALAWAQRVVAAGDEVAVHPRARLDGEAGLLLRHALQRRMGTHATKRRGISTELHGLREYQPGDPLRSLHWKATARQRRPITREDAWEQHQHVVVLVDCGRPMASLAPTDAGAHMSKLDHALTTVLALLRVIVAQGDSASLVLFSARVRRVVQVDRRTRSTGGFGRIFQEVHDLHADLDEPDYAGAAAWAVRKVPRRSLALVVSSVVDLGVAEELSRGLTTLARRHRPLLVNLQDPGLLAHARGRPETVDEAFAKVSAMSLMHADEALTVRLRSRGIDTVAASAEQLPLKVLERYLEIKATRG